ncbi:LLM class F420-dependent oxidoreductase [Streptomyces sp. NBC_01537]|uniref:LLM class F420-dependent oxidoreductase n=1 Tax=Streptomyces sp. NBC_01537 TaxID=2903896 RepID=UPI003867150C
MNQSVGRYGIWTHARGDGLAELAQAAPELEELGYGTIWLGGSPGVEDAAPVLDATSSITVATGIASIWSYEAKDVAARFAELESAHPGRFLLGLGVSHAALAGERYRRPYAAMTQYLDELDAADLPAVPADRRVLAALGPRMLELSRDRAAGAHPYLVTAEHTAEARARLGEGPLLAPELGVILEADPDRARTVARGALAMYMQLPNYTNSWLRLGFTEDDLAGGGSDRLVDALYAWGDEDRVRRRVEDFWAAGADHVALQLLGEKERQAEDRRRLAQALA